MKARLVIAILSLVVLVWPLTLPTPLLASEPPEVQWTKTFGGALYDSGYSVQQTADGGYIINGITRSFSGGDGDVYLVKTDSSGNMTWSKTFGGASEDVGYSVQPTADGGYILVGHTGGILYLVKTDSNGDMTWSKTFSETREGRSVRQTADGGYIITGITDSLSAGGYDVYLMKTDSNGNMTWRKTFGGADFDFGYSVQLTADGGYVIAGTTTSFGAVSEDVYLIKTDASGNLTWSQTFGGASPDDGYSVLPTTDGGYIIAGGAASFGDVYGDIYLVKASSNGNMTWSKTFGGENTDRGYSVQPTTDGGYIIGGYTRSFGAGNEDVYLVKTDTTGNMLWSKTLGGASSDYGLCVQQTADGGFIIVGNTNSFGVGNTDVYLIKLGPRPAVSPTVTTDNATNITGNSARLNGTLTSLGLAASANVSFQYGMVSGNYTFETPPVSMNATGAFSTDLTGLSDNTTYYFRTKAVGDGISYGIEKSFTTAELPISSWLYHKVIAISGSSSNLTDYQVKVPVGFVSGRMNSDFSDIRFVSENGTRLDHWRESYTANNTASFWVEVPSILTAGTTISMYYGNAAVSSASDFNNTFIAGNHDFEMDAAGTTYDAVSYWDHNSWTQNDGGTIGGTPAGENLTATDTRRYSGAKSVYTFVRNVNWGGNTNPAGRHAIQDVYNEDAYKVVSDASTLYIWRSDVTYTTSSRYYWRFGVVFEDGINTPTEVLLVGRAWGNSEGVPGNFYDNHDQTATGADNQTWYRHPVAIPDGFDKSKLVVKIRHQQDSWDGTTAESSLYYDLVDNYRLRKYASPEPVATFVPEPVNLNNWSYRKSIAVTGANTALTDYQVRVPVNFVAGHMNADFSDILFVAADGNTTLAHWLESSVVSANATFWVKVPFIPTNGTVIYMYYGNPLATSTSNGESTFIFFDEYSSNKIAQYSHAMTWSGSGGGRIKSIENGQLKDADNGANQDEAFLFTRNGVQLANLAFDIKLNSVSPKSVNHWQGHYLSLTQSQTSDSNEARFGYSHPDNTGAPLLIFLKDSGGTTTNMGSDTSIDGTGKTLTLAKAGNEFRAFVDSQLKWSFTDATLGANTMFAGILNADGWSVASTSYWDDFRIRNYALPEPGGGFGGEEILGIPTVTTDNVTSIYHNSARLNGTLASLGSAASANVSFQYGTGSGNYTFETEMVAMNLVGSFSANITGLAPNTTYFFRAKVVGEGIAYGTERSFTTSRLLYSDLLSRWPLDGNANDIIGTNHGTLIGANFTSGRTGLGVSLDGIDDFVDFGTGPSLNFGTDNFTFSLWVNYASLSGEQVVIEKYIETENSATRAGWSLTKISNNNLRFGGIGGGTLAILLEAANPGITVDNWIHVAVTRNGNTFTLYFNGVNVGSASTVTSPNFDSTASLKIGHRGNSIDTPGSVDNRGFFLNGSVDEVMVFKRALSADEIYHIYQHVPPTVATDNATNITSTSARLNGTLASLGSASSADVSFLWGTSSGNYTFETTPVSMNSSGSFSANLTGLPIFITYYFQAKAVGAGTSYGVERNFETAVPVVPVVTTDNATNITSTSAKLNGTLQAPVAANVSFQWGLSSGNYAYETTPILVNTVSAFSSNLTGLSANTTYYFRAKAVGDWPSGLASYGMEKSFTTLVTTVLPGDATGDGVVDARDITKVERIIAHLDPPTPGADANQDGFIDARDITKVEMIIVFGPGS